jgi:tRNA(Ile)-lysidine synthase
MYDQVRAYIAKNRMIEPEDHVIIGISGGADSVCLLFVLLELQKELSFTLEAVHVNHLLREDAAEDALFVGELCREQGVKLRFFSAKVADLARVKGLSVEEAGREYRYECFQEAASAHPKAKIAVAHHQNDCAETVLFNLFRGSGLKGLAGIRPVRDNIIRPLLCCERQEIEDYLANRGISYRQDQSNDDDIYIRNRIRHQLLPLAKEINSATIKHITNSSDLIWEAESYLRKHSTIAYRKCVTSFPDKREISIKKLNKQDLIIQKRLLLQAIEDLLPHRRDISSRHIEDLLALTASGGSQELHLSGGLRAYKKYDLLTLKRGEDLPRLTRQPRLVYPLKIKPEAQEQGRKIVIPQLGRISYRTFPTRKTKNIPQKTYTKWLDYDKISTCAVFRHRQAGDYLIINRAKQHKSLKEYLIDEKVPKEKRDDLYVLADGSHVIWVPGHRISEEYKVSEQTTTILEIQLEVEV